MPAVSRRLLSSGAARSLLTARPTLALFVLQRVFVLAVYIAVSQGQWLHGLERWDASWYRQIAANGYDEWPKLTPSGKGAISNLAFFPLFPMAGRLLAAVTPLDAGSALICLAWVGSLVGAWGVFAVGNHLGGRVVGMVLALAWGASPQAMVLLMGYPEGWLTAAVAFAILFLLTDRPVAAGLACLVAGLLQPTSLPIVTIVALWCVTRAIQSVRSGRWAAASRRYLAGAVLAPAGLVGVIVWIAVRTGRLLGYLDVQAQWDSNVGSPLTALLTMHKEIFLEGRGVVPRTAVYAPIIIGYLVLLALLVGQLRRGQPRNLPWVVGYTVISTLLVFGNQEYFNSIPRHFLPVFTLLLPLAALRSNRTGAVLALGAATIASAWWGTYFVLYSTVSI